MSACTGERVPSVSPAQLDGNGFGIDRVGVFEVRFPDKGESELPRVHGIPRFSRPPLWRTQGDFEKQHAEDVSSAFIKDYEGAEAKTRKALKNSAKVRFQAMLVLAFRSTRGSSTG